MINQYSGSEVIYCYRLIGESIRSFSSFSTLLNLIKLMLTPANLENEENRFSILIFFYIKTSYTNHVYKKRLNRTELMLTLLNDHKFVVSLTHERTPIYSLLKELYLLKYFYLLFVLWLGFEIIYG